MTLTSPPMKDDPESEQNSMAIARKTHVKSFDWKIFFAATLLFSLIFSTGFASAQAQRGTLVHEETIRVAPSADASKLGEAGRGHELVIIDISRDWTHVEAILREPKKDADEDD